MYVDLVTFENLHCVLKRLDLKTKNWFGCSFFCETQKILEEREDAFFLVLYRRASCDILYSQVVVFCLKIKGIKNEYLIKHKYCCFKCE